VVAEHDLWGIMEEVLVVCESRVSCMEPLVCLWGDQGGGYHCRCGGVSPYHISAHLFHGDVGGTKEAYYPILCNESLSGSPSSVIMWRRSLWARRVGPAGEDEGARSRYSPHGGEGEGVVARILERVGACANKLLLMGVEREEVRAKVGKAGGGWGSDARNACRGRFPPSMERM
jgi:hypothetical protein